MNVDTKLLTVSKPRNLVVKHNHNRCQRMRVRTKYQRHQKHRILDINSQ